MCGPMSKLTFYLQTNVIVAGGTGTGKFWNEVDAPPAGFTAGLVAELILVAILAPTSNATFDWNVTDVDGYAITGREGLTGNTTTIETSPIYPRGNMNILNASVDGMYRIKLYARQSE